MTTPDITTAEGRAALRALYDAATPGPLTVLEFHGPQRSNNAELVRAMHNVLPAAIQAAEERDKLLPLRVDFLKAVADQIAVDRALHPNGSCGCHGEGECQWCQMSAAKERAEKAESERDALRARVAKLERVADAAREHRAEVTAEEARQNVVMFGPSMVRRIDAALADLDRPEGEEAKPCGAEWRKGQDEPREVKP